MVLTIEPLLGTRAEISIVCTPDTNKETIEQSVVDDVAGFEKIFSAFDDSSALQEFRNTGATELAELKTVIDLATHWFEATRGAFHPYAQPLVDLWDLAESVGELPSEHDISATLTEISAAPAPMLNLNGIAKGWIADQALTKLLSRHSGVSGGWISLGGDIVHRGKGELTVGIEDPHRPYDNVAPRAQVEISNEALATSGGAHRWWGIGDKRFPKVLDPRSGWPVDRVASATVVAPDGATADVLATVAVVLAPADIIALALDSGADCYVIHKDGSITSSSDRFRQS